MELSDNSSVGKINKGKSSRVESAKSVEKTNLNLTDNFNV